ncbi:MAG: hypothetical protein AAF791_03100 [Bacteroidota bacterium]
MRAAALMVLTVALAACGGTEEPIPEEEGVFVPVPSPEDLEVPADSFDTFPEADSLALDSLIVEDSVQVTEAPAPSFAPFLAQFKQALQTGDVEAFAAEGVDVWVLANDPAFQQQVLAAPPDQYSREGTRRETWVVVGFDVEGNVVPEDEADTESGLGLVFDVVDGAYRLVRVDMAG